jgi:hypothetical protein
MKDRCSGRDGGWALWLVVMACTALHAQSFVDGAASTWASRFYVVPPAAASVEVIPAASPDGASEAIRVRVITTGAEAWRVGTSAVLTVPRDLRAGVALDALGPSEVGFRAGNPADEIRGPDPERGSFHIQ